jgi:hypothetical protein
MLALSGLHRAFAMTGQGGLHDRPMLIEHALHNCLHMEVSRIWT